MNNFKKVTAALILSAAALTSVNANAADDTSIETVINQFVVETSQQMISELNAQIELSVTHSLNALAESFAIDQALVWLASDDQEKQEKATEITAEESKEIKSINLIEE